MANDATDDDLDLLNELGVDTASTEKGGRSAKEQRIIAGFEEIERFFAEHNRLPQHGEDRDIFERLYAVRLDRLRESDECRSVLNNLDTRGLLGDAVSNTSDVKDDASDDELLAALGVEANEDITKLVHVRSRKEINAAEEVARRTACADFDKFKPIFENVQRDLDAGVRSTSRYGSNSEINAGDLFIIDGQKVLVAEILERFENFGPNGRLRAIYDNGTESSLLIRSLQNSLYKDAHGRRISEAATNSLFSDIDEKGDLITGYIYVLRSMSDHPFVVQYRDVLHKIGVTSGDVKSRIGNAKKESTYLLADVEIVGTYKLANIKEKKLEALLHKFFASACVDLALKDRFGFDVAPREWFLVPLPAIAEAVEKLIDRTIGDYRYDPESAKIVKRKD